jgi:hypothetical protein
MTNPATLNTSAPTTPDDWLAKWTDQAPMLEPDTVDEILELMGLL